MASRFWNVKATSLSPSAADPEKRKKDRLFLKEVGIDFINFEDDPLETKSLKKQKAKELRAVQKLIIFTDKFDQTSMQATIDLLRQLLHQTPPPGTDARDRQETGLDPVFQEHEFPRTVGHILLVSLVGVHTQPGKLAEKYAEMEALVRKSGIPFTILRANLWFDDLVELFAKGIRDQGQIVVSFQGNNLADIKGSRVAFVDVGDAIRVCAKILTAHIPDWNGKEIDINGEEGLSPQKIADIISQKLNMRIDVENLQLDEIRKRYIQWGADEQRADAMTEIMRLIRDQSFEASSNIIQELVELKPAIFSVFLSNHSLYFSPKQRDRVLIVGATSYIGLELVKRLSVFGVNLRVVTRRNVQSLPSVLAPLATSEVHQLITDFHFEEEALPKIVDGISTMILLLPNDSNLVKYGTDIVNAASVAGVRYIIKVSPIGTGMNPGIHLCRLHDEVGKLIVEKRIKHTFFRINMTYQLLFNKLNSRLRDKKELRSSLADAKVSFIDATDVAAAISSVIVHTSLPAFLGYGTGSTLVSHTNKRYTLTGPEAFSVKDLMEKIQKATGQTFSHVHMKTSSMIDIMKRLGFSQASATLLSEFFSVARAGFCSFTSTDLSMFISDGPTSFASFIHQHSILFNNPTILLCGPIDDPFASALAQILINSVRWTVKGVISSSDKKRRVIEKKIQETMGIKTVNFGREEQRRSSMATTSTVLLHPMNLPQVNVPLNATIRGAAMLEGVEQVVAFVNKFDVSTIRSTTTLLRHVINSRPSTLRHIFFISLPLDPKALPSSAVAKPINTTMKLDGTLRSLKFIAPSLQNDDLGALDQENEPSKPISLHDTSEGWLQRKFAEIEDIVRTSGIPFTIIRCNLWFDDLAEIFGPSIARLQKMQLLRPTIEVESLRKTPSQTQAAVIDRQSSSGEAEAAKALPLSPSSTRVAVADRKIRAMEAKEAARTCMKLIVERNPYDEIDMNGEEWFSGIDIAEAVGSTIQKEVGIASIGAADFRIMYESWSIRQDIIEAHLELLRMMNAGLFQQKTENEIVVGSSMVKPLLTTSDRQLPLKSPLAAFLDAHFAPFAPQSKP